MDELGERNNYTIRKIGALRVSQYSNRRIIGETFTNTIVTNKTTGNKWIIKKNGRNTLSLFLPFITMNVCEVCILVSKHLLIS